MANIYWVVLFFGVAMALQMWSINDKLDSIMVNQELAQDDCE